VKLQPGEAAERLRALGLPVSDSQSPARQPRLHQPCAAFDGCRCRVYAERPQYCREFECLLLKSVKAGATAPAAALRTIRTARQRADKVTRLLQALGDSDEHFALSARFRRTARRLEAAERDTKTARLYSKLSLAMHELNLLLSQTFYPGR
jgi:Fe-S-cluster containining protein